MRLVSSFRVSGKRELHGDELTAAIKTPTEKPQFVLDYQEFSVMAIEQLKSLIGAIRQDPARAPDGKYDAVSQGKTSVVADMYNLDFKDKRTLAEVRDCRIVYYVGMPANETL